MHISIANISKMTTDRVTIIIAIKYDVSVGLSISIFLVDLDLF